MCIIFIDDKFLPYTLNCFNSMHILIFEGIVSFVILTLLVILIKNENHKYNIILKHRINSCFYDKYLQDML